MDDKEWALVYLTPLHSLSGSDMHAAKEMNLVFTIILPVFRGSAILLPDSIKCILRGLCSTFGLVDGSRYPEGVPDVGIISSKSCIRRYCIPQFGLNSHVSSYTHQCLHRLTTQHPL